MQTSSTAPTLPTQGEWKKIHYNWPQQRGALVRAKKEVLVASRGFGKTRGVFAERASWNAFRMQRSLGGLVVPSYKKFLTQFVVNYIKGLADLGYRYEHDYLIGDRGDNWPLPHTTPHEWDHAMHFRCGSGIVFISMDGYGAGNAYDLDYLLADEAKHLDGKRFEVETRPAMRGNRHHFGHMSEHGSIFICSDRPVTKREKWFYSYRDQYTPEMQEGVKFILQMQITNQELRQKIAEGRFTTTTAAKYESEIRLNDQMINEVRKNLVYYHEATILDNIDVIGVEQMISMGEDMSPIEFDTALLNMEIDHVEGGWYHDMSDDAHFYDPAVTSWTMAKGYDVDRLGQRSCLHDAELIPELPLDIALDYGGSQNCMAIGQQQGDLLRIDNGIQVLHPRLLTDLLDQFTTYYAPHKCKRVNYFFDHTASGGEHGLSKLDYRETVINALRKKDWEVIPIYIGHTPDPPVRHRDTTKLLRHRPAPVVWNKDNCEDMITAHRLCQIREGKHGIEKDKRPERKSVPEQVHAPHYTDACDTLIDGRLNHFGKRTSLPTPSIWV